MFDLLLLLAGALLLYLGAEWLVGGASALALALRIPQLIVGLTVVAYGTSAPELVVGVQAAGAGHGQVALGNVIGSNIANLGLILGVLALIKPTRIDESLQRRELPILIITTLALPFVLLDGSLSTWESLALVTSAVMYTLVMVRLARKPALVKEAVADTRVTALAAEAAGAPAPGGAVRQALIAAFGLGVLLVGGNLFVEAATALARSWGMSERVVGLTVVAVGTSLPELVTGTIAAARGHSDIAIGNVLGSNIFNVLLCLGAAGLAGRVTGNPRLLVADLVALTLVTAVAAVSIRTARTMQRWEGAVLLVLYAGFLGYLLLQ
jgi:cation:H+ antiporter